LILFVNHEKDSELRKYLLYPVAKIAFSDYNLPAGEDYYEILSDYKGIDF